MRKKTKFLLGFVCILFFATHCFAAIREWTDVSGRKIQAELVGFDGDNISLKLNTGKLVSYPLLKLSDADQLFVQTHKADLPSEKKNIGASKELNFNDPWPDRVTFEGDPEILVKEENKEQKKFIYESVNFRYQCDVRLSKNLVKGFAVMFESTHLYCMKLPLGITGGKKIGGKYLILLFEDKKEYVKAGGPPQYAGVYIPARNTVLIPLESLGVKKVGEGYMLDRDKDNSTLPHEITHQLTPLNYYGAGAEGWFIEGLAEYVCQTPYRAGSYAVRGSLKNIQEYVTAYGKKNKSGRALGDKISMPSLKKFLEQDYETFHQNDSLNYPVAALVVTYFLNFDGKGDAANIKAFLKHRHDKKMEDSDRHDKNIAKESLKILLAGRTYEQLQEEFIFKWKRKGIEFTCNDVESTDY
jgi:SLA1 homology domain 1, SHD1